MSGERAAQERGANGRDEDTDEAKDWLPLEQIRSEVTRFRDQMVSTRRTYASVLKFVLSQRREAEGRVRHVATQYGVDLGTHRRVAAECTVTDDDLAALQMPGAGPS